MASPSPSERRFRVVALQPRWQAGDFVSALRFRAWLRAQLELARPRLDPSLPNLVVLTELNGMPLALLGARLAARQTDFKKALTLVVLKHLPAVLLTMLRQRVSPARALLLAQAPENAALYLQSCSDLAREYGVYLLAGSATLPHLRLEETRMVIDGAGVYNTAPLFGPDGALIGLSDKVCLTPDEETGGLDLTPGALSELRVFPTPVGDLGVAISLDAFRPDVILQLERGGATVLLQPDANGSAWTAKEGLPPDPKHLRDQPEVWLESSWQAVQQSGTLRYAVNPMVVGNLLGVAFDGQSAIVAKAEEAPALQSYVMTEPRPGFVQLAPWQSDSQNLGELRELGRRLAPGSGDSLENHYLQTVLSAELHLPSSQVAPPTATASEEAVQALLSGRARPSVSRWPLLWPLAWLALLFYALMCPRKRLLALLAGLLGAVLSAG